MDWRSEHEQHVTGHAGCHWSEVVLLFYLFVPCCVLLLHLKARLPLCLAHLPLTLALELSSLVLPYTLGMTLLAHRLPLLAGVLTAAAGMAHQANKPSKPDKSENEKFSDLQKSNDKSKPSDSSKSRHLQKSRDIPRSRQVMSVVRAVLSITTAVAILAVDFHAFPRSFAKTENFGVSVMDVGASAFLCVNAMSDVHRSGGWFSLVKSVGFLLLISSARLVSLHTSGYPQHVSEYGVHFNFFSVLAVVKLFMAVPCRQLGWRVLSLACVCMLVAQHFVTARFQPWVLADTSRATFLDANKETAVAMLGHFAVYGLAAVLAKILRKSSPSKRGTLQLLCVSLLAAAVCACVCTLVAPPPSRRLMNPSSVLWVMLLLLLIITLSECVVQYHQYMGQELPLLVQVINRNMFMFFLGSNLLTGAVNLLINTLAVGDATCVLILTLYMTLVCSVFVVKEFCF